MPNMRDVWNSTSADAWEQGLRDYWGYVKPSLLALEREFQQLNPESIRVMDEQQWFTFLLEKYFRWKFTAPNRYASTTKSLRRFNKPIMLSVLHRTKDRLFEADKQDIRTCLNLASNIGGLGIAGASGLLSVLFPEHFGTADQFAVKALRQIPDLREKTQVAAMNPESLKPAEGVLLIQIMRRKASEMNKLFAANTWTPRKVDMVLWTYGHNC